MGMRHRGSGPTEESSTRGNFAVQLSSTVCCLPFAGNIRNSSVVTTRIDVDRYRPTAFPKPRILSRFSPDNLRLVTCVIQEVSIIPPPPMIADGDGPSRTSRRSNKERATSQDIHCFFLSNSDSVSKDSAREPMDDEPLEFDCLTGTGDANLESSFHSYLSFR